MNRRKRALLSVTLLRKIAIFLPVTLIVSIDRTLAGETRSRTRLPPPPTLRQPTRRGNETKPAVNKPAVSPSRALREYVFQAPYPVRPATVPTGRTQPPPPPRPATSSARSNPPRPQRIISSDRLFRVQVSASSVEALARIRKIEPLAFIRPGENEIQAGIFPQRNQADRRVRELASIGFNARVVSREID